MGARPYGTGSSRYAHPLLLFVSLVILDCRGPAGALRQSIALRQAQSAERCEEEGIRGHVGSEYVSVVPTLLRVHISIIVENSFRGLDEDETGFLARIDQAKIEKQRAQKRMEQEEIEELKISFSPSSLICLSVP